MLARTPTKAERLSALLDAAGEAAAKLPLPAPLLPRSPFENAWGRLSDGAAHARWIREQRAGMHQPPAQPCDTPQPRTDASLPGHRFCICGWMIGSHKAVAP